MTGTNELVWSWTVDPLAGWLMVPSTVTEPPGVVDAWEREVVELVLASFEPETPEDPDQAAVLSGLLSEEYRAELRQTVAGAVANLRELADAAAPSGARVVAVSGVLDRGPVPVVVSVGTSDPDDPDGVLMAALGATGGSPVSPPNIEYLDLPDGDGMRVTRLDMDEETGGVWTSVALGRRTELPGAVVDTVLLWRTQDIYIAHPMRQALDDLLPAVRITRSET